MLRRLHKGEHTHTHLFYFYCIGTNTEDACDQITLLIMLQLSAPAVDMRWWIPPSLPPLWPAFNTWGGGGDGGRGQAHDGYRASLTWEWTAGDVNPNKCWTFAEPAPLCPNTRWKVSLSPSAMKTLPLNALSGMLSCCCCGCSSSMRPKRRWLVGRVLLGRLHSIGMQHNIWAVANQRLVIPHCLVGKVKPEEYGAQPLRSLRPHRERGPSVIDLSFSWLRSEVSIVHRFVWPVIHFKEPCCGLSPPPSPICHSFKSGAIWPWCKSPLDTGQRFVVMPTQGSTRGRRR